MIYYFLWFSWLIELFYSFYLDSPLRQHSAGRLTRPKGLRWPQLYAWWLVLASYPPRGLSSSSKLNCFPYVVAWGQCPRWGRRKLHGLLRPKLWNSQKVTSATIHWSQQVPSPAQIQGRGEIDWISGWKNGEVTLQRVRPLARGGFHDDYKVYYTKKTLLKFQETHSGKCHSRLNNFFPLKSFSPNREYTCDFIL